MQKGAASKDYWDDIMALASRGNQISQEVIDQASRFGNVEVLAKIWHPLCSNSNVVDGFPLDFGSSIVDDAARSTIAQRIVKEAARAGRLLLLDWMRNFGLASVLENLDTLPTVLATGGEEVFLWYDRHYGPHSLTFEKCIWNLPEERHKKLVTHLLEQVEVRVLKLFRDSLFGQGYALKRLYKCIIGQVTGKKYLKIPPNMERFLVSITVPMLKSVQIGLSDFDEASMSHSSRQWILRHSDEINLYSLQKFGKDTLLFCAIRENFDDRGFGEFGQDSENALIVNWMNGSDSSVMLEVLSEYDRIFSQGLAPIAKHLIANVLDNHMLSYDVGALLEYLLSFIPKENLPVQVFETLFGEKYWNVPPERLVLLWDLAIGLGFASPTSAIIENFLLEFFTAKNLKKRSLDEVISFSEVLFGWLSAFPSENLPTDSLVILCLDDFVDAAIARKDVTILFPKLVTLMEIGLQLVTKALLTALSTVPAFGLTYSDSTARGGLQRAGLLRALISNPSAGRPLLLLLLQEGAEGCLSV